jgi:hypothetical protein
VSRARSVLSEVERRGCVELRRSRRNAAGFLAIGSPASPSLVFAAAHGNSRRGCSIFCVTGVRRSALPDAWPPGRCGGSGRSRRRHSRPDRRRAKAVFSASNGDDNFIQVDVIAARLLAARHYHAAAPMQQMLTRGLRDNTAGTFQNSRALILSASLVMRSMRS